MKYLFILFIVVLLIVLIVMNAKKLHETFIDGPLAPGDYPSYVDQAILNDYPKIGKNQLSNDSITNIWWKYPIFSEPSYKQITNNLKYFKNPDIASCTPIDFCGSTYHNRKGNPTNEISPLPPVPEGAGARIGYFRTDVNDLYYSIPTNENILY